LGKRVSGSRTFREAYPRGYGAAEHWTWLLDQQVFQTALGALRALGATERSASRAWREYDVDEVERFGSERAKRYRTGAQTVASVLPPNLEGLVRLLLISDRLPDIEIPPGYRLLDGERVRKLQESCLQRLDPAGDALSSAQGKALRGALHRIDPDEPARARIEIPGPTPVGDVSVSATSAAVGSWVGSASQAGFPGVGRIPIRADEYELFYEITIAALRRRKA
jgi:hypothetical protein